MIFEELKTPRLILRKFTPEVYSELYRTYSDKVLMELLGIHTEEDLHKEKLKYTKGLSTHNKSFVWFQMIDGHSNKIIGWAGFHTWYLDHARAEIGYSLFHDLHKGKGIMTEALKVIIDYGFSQMKLNRIEAFVGPTNIPSLKLMDKFGFEKEGILKSHYFKNGVAEDSVVFGLLKTNT